MRRLNAWWILSLGLVGCDDGVTFDPGADAAVPPDVPRVINVDVPVAPRDVPRADAAVNTNPVVVGVTPDHGPFTGANLVTLRGTNFTEDALANFGGAMAQPRDTMLVDSRRLSVRPPAGRPGLVDVQVVVNGRTATLPMGYRYDAVYADPGEGSPAGGTLLTVHGFGTHFSDVTTVTLDGMACVGVNVSAPETLTCTTPAHPNGRVPMVVTTGTETITVDDAFNYLDGSEGTRGGLSGGAIAGNIAVTVLENTMGAPIPNALVFLGEDAHVAPPRSARTNSFGRAVIAVPDLRGPVTLTISAHCFNSQTIQVFDARNVTMYMYAMMIPACAMGDPPEGGGGRGTFGANISGELVWEGPNEFAPNPWRNIPMPRAGERRVAFVGTTQSDINQTPTNAGDGSTVLEVVSPGYGGRGYPFTILARPSALAVYAIAGIENIRTQRFTPYIMGVARGVLGSPRAMITRVIVPMNIPLDHQTQVVVSNLPPSVQNAPNRLRVEGFIDLGGEGVIGRPEFNVTAADGTDPFYIDPLPAFTRAIADARLIVRATYGTGDFYSSPSTTQVVSGISSPDEVLRLREWVGIPDIVSPADNGRLGRDRRVTFALRGGVDPGMYWATLSGSVTYWQTFAAGSERAFIFPDVTGIEGLNDLPQGEQLYMNIYGFRVSGFNFNEFRYSYLSSLYWSAYSTRSFLFQR